MKGLGDFWVLLLIGVGIVAIFLVAGLTNKTTPPDPCQPTREIRYECMPGGALNPTPQSKEGE